jgi:AcrR family transcriptional regulator
VAVLATVEKTAPANISCEDRRIVRTKRALRTALIELMEERGFDGFTVNDLCSRADINRGTFYNHYHDKEELLETFEDDVMLGLADFKSNMEKTSLKSLMRYRLKKEPLPYLVDLFDYLREEGPFLHAVLGSGGDVRFGPRLRDSICTTIIESILHERYRNNPEPFVQYYVSFYASAYLGVITRWIETGMKEDSEEMARIAMRLLFIRPGESIML